MHVMPGLLQCGMSLKPAAAMSLPAQHPPVPAVRASAPPRSAKLKLDRLRRRGKAPPKKGAGKRSGKKK